MIAPAGHEDDPRLLSTDYWDSDPDVPVEDWQYEVANGDTRLGYHQWARVKRDDDRPLTCDTCGRVGNSEDGIEAGEPCQEPCDGTVRYVDEKEGR